MIVYIVERVDKGDSTLLLRGRASKTELLKELGASLVDTGERTTVVGKPDLYYIIHPVEVPEIQWIPQLSSVDFEVLKDK